MNPHMKAMIIGGAALSCECYAKYGIYPNDECIVTREQVKFTVNLLYVMGKRTNDKELLWFADRLEGYHTSRCHAGMHLREFKDCFNYSIWDNKEQYKHLKESDRNKELSGIIEA
jgi:hypothetical protein